MIDINHYTFIVTWSFKDNEYIGLCAEFPSVSWLSSTPEKAMSGIRKTINCMVEDMISNKENIPTPLSERHYSGEFRVRIPPQLHRTLVVEAQEQSVSLNRLASAKLAIA
jgi:predicted HicB family RNase H-like nuclease